MSAALEMNHSRAGRPALWHARYHVMHAAMAALYGTLARVIHMVMAPGGGKPTRAAVRLLESRYRALLRRDLDNVEAGYYPRQQLFEYPVVDYLRAGPSGFADLPRVIARRRAGAHADLPPLARQHSYPRYYTRTFHWQSDGWFSDESARRYDAAVEVLFGGTGDVMRRMAVVPVIDAVAGTTGRPRVLDIACGTGRFVVQLCRAQRGLDVTGLDLSPFYLRRAAQQWAGLQDTMTSIVAANAEDMPLADASFDVATCVFTFHELPKDARRNVMREALRVLKPGGTFVVLDSAQRAESSGLGFFLDDFSRVYHEPYHKGYLADDLTSALEEVGFSGVRSEPCFVSRLVVGTKPTD